MKNTCEHLEHDEREQLKRLLVQEMNRVNRLMHVKENEMSLHKKFHDTRSKAEIGLKIEINALENDFDFLAGIYEKLK